MLRNDGRKILESLFFIIKLLVSVRAESFLCTVKTLQFITYRFQIGAELFLTPFDCVFDSELIFGYCVLRNLLWLPKFLRPPHSVM